MNKSGGVSGNSDGKENEFSLRWLEDVFEQSKGYTGANEKNENKQQKDPKLIENMTKKEEIQRQTSNDILSKEMIHQPGNISTNNSDKDISPSIPLHLLDDVIDQNENSTSGKNIACREISKETTKQKHTHETYIDDIINEITDTTTRLDKVKGTNSLGGQTLAQTCTEMATCQDRNAIFTGDENLGKARSGVENLKNRDNLLPSLKENSIEDRSNAPKLVKGKLLDSQLDAMDTVMKKTAHTEMKTPNVDVKDAILMAIETEYKDVNLDPNFRAMPTSLKDSAKNIDEMNVKTGQSSNQLITENNLIAQSLDGMIKDIQSNIDNNSNQKTKLILANEKCQKDVSETSSDNDHVGKLGTVQDSENQAGSDGKDDKSIIIDGSTQVASHHSIPDLSKLDLEGREEIDHDVRFLVDEINTDILDLDKTIVEGDATAQKIEERTDAFEKDKFKVNDSSNNEDRKCDTKLDLADTEVSGNKGKQKLVDQQSVHQDLTVESSNLSETLDNLLATDFDQSKISHDQKVSAKQQRKSIDKSKSVRHGQTQDFKARSINNSKGIVERHDRVRAKYSQEKISTKTNKLKGDQKVCMSSAEVVLLRQLGLQEKLLCMGFRADVKATGNQYTLMTNMNNPKAPREQLAAIKNSQDGISANLSAFLRQYSHLINDINRILRNKRILAGVYLDNEAVFVIGINNEEYDKAVAFLKEQYQTKEFKLHYKKNLLEDWTNVHQYFTHKFAHYHRVFVDFCINTIDKTVNTTVVGVLNEIDYVVSKAKKYLMVYKGNAHHHTSFDDRFDEFVIGKMKLLKVEFLQRFCNDDLMAIQNRYQCQVLFEANKGESSSEDSKVIIKYRHSQISTAISQIDAEIRSIPVVCKSISVGKSQFSKILRYVISEKDKGKLANLKDSLQFSIDVADVQIRRITKENSKLRAPAWKKVNRGLRVTCPSLKYNNTSFSQQASSFTYLPSKMSSMLLLNKLSPSTFSSWSCNVPIIDDNQKIDFNGKVITVLKRPLQAISNNVSIDKISRRFIR
ncbi:uncharacterized protein TRIADDRAFT_58772 [Trichoplax adhaerens]|uniref:Uncharacterized protein n=1 Tax=Trichoplax adhaerens TaxID=10228 RepID=B3S3M0_TRIAD|nr:predicted protein [Trichoplax adhaerens]EDV22825.1 predicted protein [Trichoplax adhaerens]|eukprot:XP_002114691.1 predicted protein [Trichoplax adhaerens]